MASFFNIAVIKGNRYANLAAEQRTTARTEYKVRGVISDRNMIPFAEMTADKDARYRDLSIANHVIGYVNSDGMGMSGIEKAFDEELSAQYDSTSILLDARGEVIPNFKTVNNKHDSNSNIKLTLDYHIQKICENVLDNAQITGSAVVLDVKSFDVVAMASRPGYFRDKINSYISAEGTELLNRAVSPYNAGSIFKIITTAAALEEGVVDDKFLSACRGGMRIDNLKFGCHKAEGHGIVNLEEGFSKSCNCAFYDIGVALGSKTICDYATLFGMGDYVLEGILAENRGNVPQYFACTKAEAANLCIGQGELMITPLQAARMICIIANGGVVKSVNIADSICRQDGEKISDLRQYSAKRIVSAETAERIGAMMLKATEEGTGTNAKSEIVSIAGKTGSAETGWQTENGYMVQGWFVGFFPYENPRYALAVMTENGRQGNISCAPVFKEIAEKIIAIKKS